VHSRDHGIDAQVLAGVCESCVLGAHRNSPKGSRSNRLSLGRERETPDGDFDRPSVCWRHTGIQPHIHMDVLITGQGNATNECVARHHLPASAARVGGAGQALERHV
jgi:hypothetical protein